MFPNKIQAKGLEYVFLLCVYKYVHGSLPAGCTISSQTAQHLLSLTKHLDQLQGGCFGYDQAISLLNYISHKRPKKVVDNIIALEQQYAHDGYYTFVHGQRWQYRLAEQWTPGFGKRNKIAQQVISPSFIVARSKKKS